MVDLAHGHVLALNKLKEKCGIKVLNTHLSVGTHLFTAVYQHQVKLFLFFVGVRRCTTWEQVKVTL